MSDECGPAGWEEARLDDVAQLVRGITFPTSAKGHEPREGAVACLRTANVQAEVEWEDLWYVPRDYVKHDEQYVQSGDVLISTANSYELVGKVARVKAPHQEASLGAFISLLRAEAGVCSTYFYYLMSSDSIQRAIREMASTTTNLSNVSGGKLKELQLLIAPSAEQTRIVEKLEELLSDLDVGVAELKAAQRKLVQYRQSLLKAAVEGTLTAGWCAARTRYGELQETGTDLLQRILTERRARWEAKQLARYAEQGKTPPKGWQVKYPEPVAPDTTNLSSLPMGWTWASIDQLSPSDLANGRSVPTSSAGAKVLRLTSVKNGRIDLAEFKHGSWSDEEAQPFSVAEGDLLIVRGNGSLSLVGRAGLVPKVTEPMAYPDTMIRLRTIDSVVCRRWVASLWESSLVRSHLEERARTSAGIYKISQPDIVTVVIPIPPVAEQEAILAVLDQSSDELKTLRETLLVAEKQSVAQRKNILKAAFAGQLVPQDPNDEPASALLERIRTKRASRTGTAKPRGRKPRTTA